MSGAGCSICRLCTGCFLYPFKYMENYMTRKSLRGINGLAVYPLNHQIKMYMQVGNIGSNISHLHIHVHYYYNNNIPLKPNHQIKIPCKRQFGPQLPIKFPPNFSSIQYRFLSFVFNIGHWFLWWLSFLTPPSIKERPIVLYQPASRRIAVPLSLEGLNT